MMFAPSEDQQPLTYFRGYPVYATHAIVGFYVVTMLVCTLAGPGGSEAMIRALGYNSQLVHSGEVWRVFTYGLVNLPSLSFVIDMVMIVWFGRELERFFGRVVFLKFYGMLYLCVPLLFTLLGLIRPMSQVGQTGGLAIFVAFATLYPNAMMIFNILAKWFAAVILAIYTLMFLFARDFVGLAALWGPVSFAYGFVRYQQGRFTLPSIPLPSFRKRPKLRVVREAELEREAELDEPMAEMDALLDKIAKGGINSLSSSERQRLEKAREALLKRETRR
jgi:membrane associated rhomboid family serine protease